MDIKISNFEWRTSREKTRLKATCDVTLNGSMLFRNCCLFSRTDGSRYLRLPVREIPAKGKPTVYSEMVHILDDKKRAQFHAAALHAIDSYLAANK